MLSWNFFSHSLLSAESFSVLIPSHLSSRRCTHSSSALSTSGLSQLSLDPNPLTIVACAEPRLSRSYHPYNSQIVRFSAMPLFDRRQEYSWPATKLEGVQLLPAPTDYSLDD